MTQQNPPILLPPYHSYNGLLQAFSYLTGGVSPTQFVVTIIKDFVKVLAIIEGHIITAFKIEILLSDYRSSKVKLLLDRASFYCTK